MSKIRDLETTAKIKLALIANPHVGGLDIGVDTINGIVFLKGFVQDSGQKLLAEEIARSHGGFDVKNDIDVLADSSESVEFIKADPYDSIEDEAIRKRVLDDLTADSRVNVPMVNVDCLRGVITLSGVQDEETGIIRAEEISRQVQGVRNVVNHIRIRK